MNVESQILECLRARERDSVCLLNETRHEKTCLWDLRQVKSQTGLLC